MSELRSLLFSTSTVLLLMYTVSCLGAASSNHRHRLSNEHRHAELGDFSTLVYFSLLCVVVLPSGGRSLKRRLKREEKGGVNHTCPRCPCTVGLSSGRVSRREPCCWTLKATHYRRSLVRCFFPDRCIYHCVSLSISNSQPLSNHCWPDTFVCLHNVSL